ncbi:MAG: hypothetical protein ACKVG6_16690 [Alphaproteobacteria bacterium]|jgi:hypothetical protein
MFATIYRLTRTATSGEEVLERVALSRHYARIIARNPAELAVQSKLSVGD